MSTIAEGPDKALLALEQEYFRLLNGGKGFPLGDDGEQTPEALKNYAQADHLAAWIKDIPAQTMAGIAAKLRVADDHKEFRWSAANAKSPEIGDEMLASVIADAERLASG